MPVRPCAALEPLTAATRPQFPSWPPVAVSDLRLFRYLEGVVDLDAQVPHCRLQLGVAEQQLHSAQVLGAPVDQRRFRSTHRSAYRAPCGPSLARLPSDRGSGRTAGSPDAVSRVADLETGNPLV